MDFPKRKTYKTRPQCYKAHKFWTGLWVCCGLSLLVSGAVGCAAGSARKAGPAHLNPSVSGVDFAVFFGFSADRDTLWLKEANGGWVAMTRSDLIGERYGADAVVNPKVATWSTTHAPHLMALPRSNDWVASGYTDRIGGLDAEGKTGLVYLGGDGGLDEEALVASGATVLTSYPFGDPMNGVEERTGVRVVPLREYEEPAPLARAEYVKVFGWLTGQLPAADSVFNAIVGRYDAARLRGLQAAQNGGRPVVFTGSEQGGRWTAPAGDGLVARLVEDAGGAYLLSAGTERALDLRRVGSNIEMDREQFAVLAADADAWGKVVYAPEGWYKEDAAAALSWLPMDEMLLFHCNTAQVDYFGAAVLEPDRMLSDLVAVLHGLPVDEGATPYFEMTQPRP